MALFRAHPYLLVVNIFFFFFCLFCYVQMIDIYIHTPEAMAKERVSGFAVCFCLLLGVALGDGMGE